jgi:hypothetical protein
MYLVYGVLDLGLEIEGTSASRFFVVWSMKTVSRANRP